MHVLGSAVVGLWTSQRERIAFVFVVRVVFFQGEYVNKFKKSENILRY